MLKNIHVLLMVLISQDALYFINVSLAYPVPAKT